MAARHDLPDSVAMLDLARIKQVTTTMGLQTRATPAFAYLRDLVRGGFVGEVLSASMIGSGIRRNPSGRR
jgi:predicted dehydrogenase